MRKLSKSQHPKGITEVTKSLHILMNSVRSTGTIYFNYTIFSLIEFSIISDSNETKKLCILQKSNTSCLIFNNSLKVVDFGKRKIKYWSINSVVYQRCWLNIYIHILMNMSIKRPFY